MRGETLQLKKRLDVFLHDSHPGAVLNGEPASSRFDRQPKPEQTSDVIAR